MLTNNPISVEGRQTKIDNISINRNGVFIIEVKNYSGELYGSEEDFEWIKNKVTDYGNLYQKRVKNPIKQVKRQIYLLATYLKDSGIKAWVVGYVFLVEHNSPVESKYVLNTRDDIDKAIHSNHSKSGKQLDRKDIEKIMLLLSTNG